ncbi:hypothetical protein EVAR_98930_1 [Eumeta japonica]|uniref:Uncharacterized protein n=1 Tax=Eumeta variegata TaxID=151549 RepID=A0A4C2A3X4_EUMVA|nr:hypothetical protein EVAR_98930_1 [Eumeta japonica]
MYDLKECERGPRMDELSVKRLLYADDQVFLAVGVRIEGDDPYTWSNGRKSTDEDRQNIYREFIQTARLGLRVQHTLAPED